MNSKPLAILGASGHGKVLAEIAELNSYQVVFFDDAYPEKSTIEHWHIVGNTAQLIEQIDQYQGVSVAIGNNHIRASKCEQLLSLNVPLITLVHPTASVSTYASLGAGSVVMAGARVNPFAQIGIAAIVNTGAVVEHDCFIGNYAHVSPNASLAGECKLGHKAWLGIGSCVKQQLSIGDETVIGAGSVVVDKIPAATIAYGNPAKINQE